LRKWGQTPRRQRVDIECKVSARGLTLVVDYFRWRHEDAHGNALTGHCYWLLRKQGHSARRATKALNRISSFAKADLLLQNGIDFAKVPG
jgi:tRNA(His) 5'-end guanylyltransferase